MVYKSMQKYFSISSVVNLQLLFIISSEKKGE